MVPSKECHFACSSHQRFPECQCGLLESQRFNHSHGMVYEPSNHQQNTLSVDRSATVGLVCYQVQRQVSSLHVSCGRSSGHGQGCPKSGLDQHDSLCLSPSCHTSSGPQQDNAAPMHSLPSGSQLAAHGMVSSDSRSSDRLSTARSSDTSSLNPAWYQDLPSKSCLFRLTRLQTVQRCMQAKGFSPSASQSISEKHRQSSELCYERYWQRFLSWCNQRDEHPLFIPVTSLADFLDELAKSLQIVPSTLDSIKSCILITIKACTDKDYINTYELTAITSKYHKDCPAIVFKLPDWNLVLVLEQLCKSPFEPLHEASFKLLTYKTVFLVAMACSCRVSELHALAFNKLSHTPDWDTVFLEAKSDFLAKNQSSRDPKFTRQFKLKALVKPAHKVSFVSGSVEAQKYNKHKLLCPVRALRMYLARSHSRRTSTKKALFVSLHAKHKNDITKQSVGNWVRKTILLCYNLVGDNPTNLGRATVHEIRALTSSIKFERNLSLDSVLKSCIWKHNNTFTKYYLRDVATVSDDLYRLPPVFMSQCRLN